MDGRFEDGCTGCGSSRCRSGDSGHLGQHFFERLPIIRSYYRLYTLIREIRSLELLNRFDIAVVPHGRVDSDFSAHAVWM